jgi:hypothetical protein
MMAELGRCWDAGEKLLGCLRATATSTYNKCACDDNNQDAQLTTMFECFHEEMHDKIK